MWRAGSGPRARSWTGAACDPAGALISVRTARGLSVCFDVWNDLGLRCVSTASSSKPDISLSCRHWLTYFRVQHCLVMRGEKKRETKTEQLVLWWQQQSFVWLICVEDLLAYIKYLQWEHFNYQSPLKREEGCCSAWVKPSKFLFLF